VLADELTARTILAGNTPPVKMQMIAAAELRAFAALRKSFACVDLRAHFHVDPECYQQQPTGKCPIFGETSETSPNAQFFLKRKQSSGGYARTCHIDDHENVHRPESGKSFATHVKFGRGVWSTFSTIPLSCFQAKALAQGELRLKWRMRASVYVAALELLSYNSRKRKTFISDSTSTGSRNANLLSHCRIDAGDSRKTGSNFGFHWGAPYLARQSAYHE